MKIGLSSASFYPGVSTEECIPLMSELGINLGEIFLNSPSEYEYDFIEKLDEQRKNYNFEINSVHAFCAAFEPFLFDRYERRRTDMLKFFKNVCKAAHKLNAECYTFHGMRNIELRTLNMEFVIERYNELAYIAGEEGIKLAQENVSWCMSSDISFLSQIKESCRYPIYFTLDLKQAYKAGKEPWEYMKVMGKDLVNFHVNDKDKHHVCLLPGKGEIDFKSISQGLKCIGYSGNAIIEIYSENYTSYEEIIESKNYLSQVF